MTIDSMVDSPLADSSASDSAPEVGACETGGGSIAATISADVFANCMPSVPADPVHVSGMITVKNDTGCAIGPVTAESGVLEDGTTAWASFKIDKVDLGVIAPGATKTATYTKTTGTLMHDPSATLCGSMSKCDSEVRVTLLLKGYGASSGNAVDSPSGSFVCAY